MQMQAQRFEGKALPYVLVAPEAYVAGDDYPLVVMLHGFGAHMGDLAGLAPAIDSTGYVYAFPNAPYQVHFVGGTGFSWLANRDGVEPPPAGAPPVDELLQTFLDEVIGQTQAARGRIVLGGFSQGGGMTLRFGLPRADVFPGLAVLSGAFRDPEEARKTLPPQRTQRIFVAHGRYDPLISLERAQETKSFLEELGYAPVYKEYDMAHEISPGTVRDLAAWLHETLPPRG